MADQDIASQLHQWAIEEMHFHPKGRHLNAKMPSVQQLRMLCRGQMNDVWSFIIKHVRSAQTVLLVEGNLAVRDGHRAVSGAVSTETDELRKKHQQLATKLTSAMTDISHVERDLKRLHSDIASTEVKVQKCMSHVDDHRRCASLLTAHSQLLAEKSQMIQEFTGRLQNKRLALEQSSKNASQTYYNIDKRKGEAPHQSNLETACTSEVRSTCEQMEGFLRDLLDGKFSSDKSLLSKRREVIWRQLEALLRIHPVDHFLLSLNVVCQDATLALRQKTAAIDIEKDAQRLRFKYSSEGGHLADLSSRPSLLTSVRQLLEQSQKTNIERFIETERSKNHAFRLSKRLTETKERVLNDLRRKHADDSVFNAARSLMECELELSAVRASRRVLEESSGQLREQIALALRQKEALIQKQHTIQQFKTIADGKQNLIQVLVKQNLGAHGRLDSQQKEIADYISGCMQGHSTEIQTRCAALKDGVRTEVDSFATLSLPCLRLTTLSSTHRISLLELSIERLRESNLIPGSKTLQLMKNALNFPDHKGPEEFVIALTDLVREIHDLESALKKQETEARTAEAKLTAHCSTAERVAELCEQIGSLDQRQRDQVLPTLRQRLGQTTHALTECLQLKDLANQWWEQPAQNIVPWMKVDDMSLREWRDKWTVTVTQLHQVQANQA